MKKPKDSNNYMANPVKNVLVNVSKYLNIDTKKTENKQYLLNDYQNMSPVEVSEKLTSEGLKVITLGTGNKIINQYPKKNMNVVEGDLVVLLTNNQNNTMPNLIGLSYKECKIILDFMKVEYNLLDFGYAYEQNIPPGEEINKTIEIKFKKLY